MKKEGKNIKLFQDKNRAADQAPTGVAGYRYPRILDKDVRKDWLGGKNEGTMPAQKYRQYLSAAMQKACDNFKQRLEEKGMQLPESLKVKPNPNMKTVDPEVPDFASKRYPLHKFAGICIKSHYQRFFTVDKENFKYYINQNSAVMQKAMELEDCESFVEYKSEWMANNKVGKNESGDRWDDPNSQFRVVIKLVKRQKKPIFYYTQSLHDAKILQIQIEFFSVKYQVQRLPKMIEMAYKIEKATRFQKIMSKLVWAMEKKQVMMNDFQELAYDLVQVSAHSEKLRRQVVTKWFTSILGDDEKHTIRSSMRISNPTRQVKGHNEELNEKKIKKLMGKMTSFIQNRRTQRLPQISDVIKDQAKIEMEGILAEDVKFDEFIIINNREKWDTQINTDQAYLILDPIDNYSHLVIENRTLANISPHTSKFQKIVKKIPMNDISYITTDLHPINQFDYNSKLVKQPSYTITLHGRQATNYNQAKSEFVAPHQLGLDINRKRQVSWKIDFEEIEFPKYLKNDPNVKVTIYPRVYQYVDAFQNVRPHFFELVSEGVKLNFCQKNIVFREQKQKLVSFVVEPLSLGSDEKFAIGLEVRINRKATNLVMEKYLTTEKFFINSYDQNIIFPYKQMNLVDVKLKDNNGDQSFRVQISVHPKEKADEFSEPIGKRLLVGRYVLYDGKVAYLKNINMLTNKETKTQQFRLSLIEVISKNTIQVQLNDPKLELIEDSGVCVYKDDELPAWCEYNRSEWKLTIRTKDKGLLNQIHQKIRFNQYSLANRSQDTYRPDPLKTIQGHLTIQMEEVRGLILPSEVNRKKMDVNNIIDPRIQIYLMDFYGKIINQHHFQKLPDQAKSTRELNWQSGQTKSFKDSLVDLGDVSHSGNVNYEHKLVQVSHSKGHNDLIRRKSTQKQDDGQFQSMLYVKIKVVNAANKDALLGEVSIEVDELIDINLRDLAKEYCVCLNRTELLNDIFKKQLEGKSESEKEKILSQQRGFTQYSGIVRFLTLFTPTDFTSVRFQHIYRNHKMTIPKQLLHFEYLQEKSDFDTFKYKIPQPSYNPNSKSIGADQIDLPSLISQCGKNQELATMLELLKLNNKSALQEKQALMDGGNIKDDLFKQILKLNYQSPFEKLYIILKLQRKERPYTEQLFFNFKNVWELYKQSVINTAYFQLNQNEWFSFIEELGSKQDVKTYDDYIDAMGDTLNAQASMTIRDPSFVNNMARRMNEKALQMKNDSITVSKRISVLLEKPNQKEDVKTQFSLVLCSEWEKSQDQKFVDLVALIRSGVPASLRCVVWSDLMKSSLIEIEEKKKFVKNFPDKFIKEKSVFENYDSLQEQYDCISFRQIDEDIKDFKFPAYFHEETIDQNIQDQDEDIFGSKITERINKLVYDKQLMRKLLRILVVWGKLSFANQETNQENFCFSYATGFLKVVHRFINMMAVEDAFWILIGIIKKYPRLFCLKNTSLLDDGKSNFRYEMTVMKAVLKVNFSNVADKLYMLGIPLESVIYDSLTCLYSDYFHSDILLRIWDQMIFNFNTSQVRRGIWLILAPAMLIFAMNSKKIANAKTSSDVFQAYKDGCAKLIIPNESIDMVNKIIDDIFVLDQKIMDQNIKIPIFDENGATGEFFQSNQNQMFAQGNTVTNLFNLSSRAKIWVNPVLVDNARAELQKQLDIVNAVQKQQSQVVHDMLFVFNKQFKKDVGVNKVDIFDFEDDSQQSKFNDRKPPLHSALNYEKWRTYVIRSLSNQLMSAEEIEYDDVYDFEDVEIFNKDDIDIQRIHIYLHNLQNWYGVDEGDSKEFRVEIQYGRLQSNGKFEVRAHSQGGDNTIMKDENMQYFENFKYSSKYNFFKVKIMKVKTKEKVCHCYVDLRGFQKGKFIQLLTTMNAKEYISNAESKYFNMVMLKMSIFLESKKDDITNDSPRKEEGLSETKMNYLYSFLKPERGLINIQRPSKEHFFQSNMIETLKVDVAFDWNNFKNYIKKDSCIDYINNKFNFTDIIPRQQYGHISKQDFIQFIKNCLPPELMSNIFSSELEQVYEQFVTKITETSSTFQENAASRSISDYQNQYAVLNTNSNDNVAQSGDNKFFSMRSFIFSVLFQSPITVLEKLDVLYDISNMCCKFVDGIDLKTVTNIFNSVLKQHQVVIPYNELLNQTERVFNQGQICNVIHAFWTRKFVDQIKFDMDMTFTGDGANIISFDDFITKPLDPQPSKKYETIDLTKEFLETFNMYQNMYGNKVLDFNLQSSLFSTFNNLLLSKGKNNLGTQLLTKVNQLGEVLAKKYRLCIVSQIQNGERVLTEIFYDSQTGQLINQAPKATNSSKQQEEPKFKQFFMRNINVLNLHSRNKAIGKIEFMEGAKNMPFVFDLMRAESFWQDNKYQSPQSMQTGQQSAQNRISLSKKARYKPGVRIFFNHGKHLLVFRFDNSIQNTQKYQIEMEPTEQSPMFQFYLGQLYKEDIMLDIKDKIINCLKDMNERGNSSTPLFSNDLINMISGKKKFYVRKIFTKDGKVNANKQTDANNLRWMWQECSDFERLIKFEDDEEFKNEIIFKLINSTNFNMTDMDEKPKHLIDGYDCYSIYKHSDNSYEWRLCKIKGKVLRPQFKASSYAKTFLMTKKKTQLEKYNDLHQEDDETVFDESNKYYFYLEFMHLKDYGAEMWCKRRREDIIPCAEHERSNPNFKATCKKFVMANYSKDPADK